MSIRDSALLLLGHGSTLNADSSAPTYQHAEEIRRRGDFAEVHVAFWKEEPNFRQALYQTRCRQVYVVPNFISSGYFTEQVIPRELGLTGPITHLDGQEIFYCQPVGLHPSMNEALLRRADEVVSKSLETITDPAKSACLFICGHGTSFNDNSTKIIHEQAEIIRASGRYADCQAVLMEQSPFVKDWRTLTSCPDVIVVPFFISDGLHSFEDIPVLLGLTHNIKEKGFTNPHHEQGRRLWYATAIGTEMFLADVIVAQVRLYETRGAQAVSLDKRLLDRPNPDQELARLFEQTSPPWKIGEVVIRPATDGGYDLFHEDDLGANFSRLRELKTKQDVRELIRLDRDANFRPLRAAPNLSGGWIYHASDISSLHHALDYFYPAALANWTRFQHGALTSTDWTETSNRQTGRFRIVREMDDAGLTKLVANYCERGCLKRRLWSSAQDSFKTEPNEIPLLCPEACNFLVGKVREKIKGAGEE